MAESAAACSSSITIASTTTTSDSETEGSSVSLLDKLKGHLSLINHLITFVMYRTLMAKLTE